MDHIRRDKAQTAVEQIFTEYEITDASIAALDLIIIDIMKVVTKACDESYDDGYAAARQDTEEEWSEELSTTAEGRKILERLAEDHD